MMLVVVVVAVAAASAGLKLLYTKSHFSKDCTLGAISNLPWKNFRSITGKPFKHMTVFSRTHQTL
jgi:hypothetical protein